MKYDRFINADIRACYSTLHMQQPANISAHLAALRDRKPKQLLYDSKGYHLERRVRDQFDKKYGLRRTAVQIDQLLRDLPAQVSVLTERTFLDEALICFKYGAFRASIVMTWNLAYDHLCHYIYNHHIASFNSQLPKTFPKAGISAIAKYEDFAELKESQVIQVCRSAGIISSDINKVLKEKLDRRNSAAHPSNVIFTQLQSEDFISDLINNVVLKLV